MMSQRHRSLFLLVLGIVGIVFASILSQLYASTIATRALVLF